WKTSSASTSASRAARPKAAPSSTEASVPRATTSIRDPSAACAASATASRSARRSKGTDASQNVLYGTAMVARGRSVEMPDLLEAVQISVHVGQRDDHVLEPLRPACVGLVRTQLC